MDPMVNTRIRGTCSYPDCGKPHDSRGYCKGHAAQIRRSEKPKPLRVWGVYQKDNKCSVIGCDTTNVSKGLCNRHFRWAKKYGMTPEQMDEYNAIQQCQVCGSNNNLVVDHDHSCCAGKNACGKCIRGVLCSNCNTALGYAGDDADRLMRLARYLQ